MRLLIPALLALILSGCERDTPQAVLNNYLERVATTLDKPIPPAATTTTAPLPRRRERQLAVEELRAGLLDALDLAECGLLPLISERNSILGKVKQPSAVMSYEFRFYEVLEHCYRRDQATPLADEAFSELLANIYQIKRRNLFPVVWNALFTSSELEQNLSLSKPPIPLTGNAGYGDSMRALQVLQGYRDRVLKVVAGGPFTTPDTTKLEQQYFALYASEYGGQLFSSVSLLTTVLNQIAALLEAAAHPRPLCLSSRPIPRAQNLKNVFDRFYVGEVQPYMALIQRQGPPWLSLMDELASQPTVELITPLESYRLQMLSPSAEHGLWQRYQRSIERHTRAWQQVLRQCGLMPGQSSPS